MNVKARPGEKTEFLVKRFKRSCERDRLMDEIRKRSAYEKPSDERRRKMKTAKNRRAHALAELQLSQKGSRRI